MKLFEALHTGLPSIVTDPIPYRARYLITGAHGGRSWTVDEGVGIGAPVAVSDPACPFGTVTYTVTVNGASVAGTLTRRLDTPLGVDALFTSEDGRSSVAATWEGDAASGWDPGSAFAQPLGSRRPVQTRPLVPGGPSWDVMFRVDLADVEEARRVLDSGRLWIVHDAAHTDGGSPMPDVMLAAVDGRISEGRWPEGRTYSLTVRELDLGVTGVAVVTFGEAKTVWSVNTTFDSIRETTGGA